MLPCRALCLTARLATASLATASLDATVRNAYALHEDPMRLTLRKRRRIAVCAALVFAFAVAALAQYTITVSKERLLNAQNEPQNWLMMNGDYGATDRK